jgi:hypothetical protein
MPIASHNWYLHAAGILMNDMGNMDDDDAYNERLRPNYLYHAHGLHQENEHPIASHTIP